MLSEARFKQKWSVDPNGSNWSKDTTKFGSKMLEKMGWTQGKGLGANEDGRTEHVRVKKKNDLRGVGFSNKDAHNWVAHQDGFSSLLADLNGQHGDNADPTAEVASLERRSKSQKRVHYHKFTRGKDLSNYRQNDLDAIFGVRSSKSAPATPADSSDGSTSGEDSSASCPPVDKHLQKHKVKKAEKVQYNQVTSTMNVHEYFAQRMAAIKKKQKSEDNVSDSDNSEGVTSTTKDSEVTEESSVSLCHVQVVQNETKADRESETEKGASLTNKNDLETANSSVSPKKLKKRKKSTKEKVDELEPRTSDFTICDPTVNVVDSSACSVKKKKKGKKRSREMNVDEIESSTMDSNKYEQDVSAIDSCSTAKKRKKSKKAKEKKQ